MKKCSQCGRELTDEKFNKHKIGKNGLRSECKDCQKVYAKKYRETHIEQAKVANKKWYKDNSERASATTRARHLANPEKRKSSHKAWCEANQEKTRAYSEANRERINAASRAWENANPERVKSGKRAWREANPEKTKQYKHLRKALELELPCTLIVTQWEKIKSHFNNSCCYCGKEKPLEQEHFIPVTSSGSSYDINNIVPACRSCNSSKCKNDFFNWYPRYKHYSKKRETAILKFLNYKNGIQQLALL